MKTITGGTHGPISEAERSLTCRFGPDAWECYKSLVDASARLVQVGSV